MTAEVHIGECDIGLTKGKAVYTMSTFETNNAADSWRRFRRRFANRNHVFLPVIYASDEKQALQNVEIAREADADGVFLLNHGIGHQRLMRITKQVIAIHPDLFVGVNCLDLRPQDVICRLPDGVEGVWANNPPTPDGLNDSATAIRQARQTTGWDGLLFAPITAAVAGGGTPASSTLIAAMHYVDVPTIVGNGSGLQKAPQVCWDVRRVLGDRPLGIASSIDSDSIDTLLPCANCVMTAACVNNLLEQMDSCQARQLATKTHACRETRSG